LLSHQNRYADLVKVAKKPAITLYIQWIRYEKHIFYLATAQPYYGF
jgi:ribosome biogenesis GTPase A